MASLLSASSHAAADGNRTAYTTGKWGSVLAAHPGVTADWQTQLVFCVRIGKHENPAGCAIGLVDKRTFNPASNVVGASRNSWAYSMTGEKGDGSGLVSYASKFVEGAAACCVLK